MKISAAELTTFALCVASILEDVGASDPSPLSERRFDERKDRRLGRRSDRGDVRGRDVAHMPSPPEPETVEANSDVVLLRSAKDLVQQLNMTLAPPENKILAPIPRGSGSLLRSDMVKSGAEEDLEAASSWADESADFAKQVVSHLVPGLTGDVPGSLIRRMTQGVEKRKARTLQQQGILYDPKTAIYRNPLGLPCDPRTHPLLCTLDEEFTSSTSTKSLLQQHRQAKKEMERQMRASIFIEQGQREYNPFEDGPLLDDLTPPETSTQDTQLHPDDFVGEVVARRRRKTK